MRLTVTSFMTMDGVVQAPGGPEEDPRDGFEQGGWQVPYADDDMGEIIDARMAAAGAFLLGRYTYQIFAGYWPHVSDDNPVARTLNGLPKYVASTTLTEPEPVWAHSTLLGPDPAAAVAELKAAEGGDLQVFGSGRLVRFLLAHGLVDELQVLVYPVVLGAGHRLFPDGSPATAFRLTSSRTTSAGVLALTYEPDGSPRYGSFMVDQEPEEQAPPR